MQARRGRSERKQTAGLLTDPVAEDGQRKEDDLQQKEDCVTNTIHVFPKQKGVSFSPGKYLRENIEPSLKRRLNKHVGKSKHVTSVFLSFQTHCGTRNQRETETDTQRGARDRDTQRQKERGARDRDGYTERSEGQRQTKTERERGEGQRQTQREGRGTETHLDRKREGRRTETDTQRGARDRDTQI